MKRSLIAIHRWLGVPLSVVFAMWFASAIGTMYWEFPSVSPQDRLAHGQPLDPASIMMPIVDAVGRVAAGATPDEVRLNMFDGRPVYRLRIGGVERVVYADTGEERGAASTALMRRVAARWARRPELDARIDRVTTVDQWTVQGPLLTLRPLWKFTFGDGQQVYIGEATGDVVQYTTTASRIGAYLGPVPHWLYFTPLRQHPGAWTRVVIWTSAAGTISAALGLVIGILMSAPARRVPYRGQKRWHTFLGLTFGVGAVTWAFSGMLSMDPFPAAARPPAMTVRTPLALDRFMPRAPGDAVAALAPRQVKELEWVSVLDEPSYVATLEDGSTRVVPIRGVPVASFDVDRLAAALAVRGATVARLGRYDAHYLDRRGRKPLPVLRARSPATRSDTYIDPSTAAVVATYADRDWTTRWLYHGLHSLDFPWLYTRRPLWDAIVIAFMIGGLTLSATSLMLAWRVARGFRRRRSMQ